MSEQLYCTACGSVGAARVRNRGSSALEIMLWLCFVVPGFCYSIWRMGRRDRYCRACAAPNPIPLSSPIARQALIRSSGWSSGAIQTAGMPPTFEFGSTTRQISLQLMLGIVVAPYVFGWFLLQKGYSNGARAVAAAWGLLLVLPIVVGAFLTSPAGQVAPSPAARSASPEASEAASTKAAEATPPDREWDSYLDGHRIRCGIAAGSMRYYLVIPTPDEYADGERVIANKNPSEAMWQMACGKHGVIGSW